jgi:hypothetical protein
MSYRLIREGHLFVAVWHVSQVEDVTPMLVQMKQMKAERGTLYFVSVITEKTPVPPAATRKEMTRRLNLLNEVSNENFVVVEGDNIRRSVVRTIVRAMSMLGGVKTHICASLADVIDALGDRSGTTLEVVDRQLKDARPK